MPPTLADLRQAVRIRLRDFDHTIPSMEIDYEINRQLDLWTRDTEIVQIPIIQDIEANSNPQILIAPDGYQIGRILSVKINQDGQDVLVLERRSVWEMDREYVDWRDSETNSDIPSYWIPDYPANGGTPVTNSMWLWPGPNTLLPGGLVVTCVAATDNLLKLDEDEIPVQAWRAKEALVEGVIAAIKERLGDDAGSQRAMGRAMNEGKRARRMGYVERSSRGGSRVYWT